MLYHFILYSVMLVCYYICVVSSYVITHLAKDLYKLCRISNPLGTPTPLG